MKRREFLKTGAGSVATFFAGASLVLKSCHTAEDMIGESTWIVEGSFDRPLPIPGVRINNINLNASPSVFPILKGKTSTTLTYADGILGPTIRADRDTSVSVRLENNLDEDTNVHWHGLILPENMDGHPKDVAKAGGSYNYELPIQQRAGTYWYHPHPHGHTARQVFMGLAGLFIVNDPEEAALTLPPGQLEIPLIIQDKRFDGSSLDYSPTRDEIMTGYLGEEVLVNGMHAPLLNVSRDWYRFRVLNGSTARVYNMVLSNNAAMHVIGSDGGLLRSPETVTSLLLGPGERVDILVDFSNHPVGTELFLSSNSFSKYNLQGRQSFKIMKIKVTEERISTFNLPPVLSNFTSIQGEQVVNTRTFDISGAAGGHGEMGGQHGINGKPFEMDRIDFTVKSGTTEVWQFDNVAGEEIHPMHIHGVQFQVIERTGGRSELMPHEKGWKDTVLVMPGEKVSVIMTFPTYTGVFVMHCHNLEHEDDGMMLNYQIV